MLPLDHLESRFRDPRWRQVAQPIVPDPPIAGHLAGPALAALRARGAAS
ncbi:hypothetical protein L083_6170 [Actinoplanes sp. N902-109]|nr:hypothetical protein L083_6170 [Actinoplanes sp. N902-109]